MHELIGGVATLDQIAMVIIPLKSAEIVVAFGFIARGGSVQPCRRQGHNLGIEAASAACTAGTKAFGSISSKDAGTGQYWSGVVSPVTSCTYSRIARRLQQLRHERGDRTSLTAVVGSKLG